MGTAGMNAMERVKDGMHRVVAVAVLAVVLVITGCGGASSPLQTGGIDFTMAVTPGSHTAGNGNGARYTVTVAPPAMIGSVDLSVSGLPAGVNAAFSPGFDVNGSRDLNVFTTATTPQANAQLIITGSDPSGSRSATVNLTVTAGVDFGLSVTPNLQIVKPGASADYTVSATFFRNATGPVNLKVLGLPPGATAVFNPASIGPSQTSTLTLTAGLQFITEGFLLSLVGTDSSGTLSMFFGFDIFPADFQLTQSVGDVIVNAGGTVTGQIDARRLFGSPGPISLSANLPTATTAAFNPSTIAAGSFSTMTISTSDGTPSGDYGVTVKGADASGTNLVIVPLEVAPGNPTAGFFLAARPTFVILNVGEPATFFITVSNPNGAIPPLTFTASTDNNLVDAAVAATSTPGVYELDVSTSPFLSSNTGVSVTAVGTGPNGMQSISVNLIIQ